MREEEITRLVEALNGSEVNEEIGNIVYGAIDRVYNTFDSYTKISKAIIERLTESGKKRFLTVWAICGFELAWHYAYSNYDEWDKRKEESEIYAHKNISLIEEIFEKNCGIKISFSEVTPTKLREKNQSFSDWFVRQIYMIDEDWTYIRNNRWLERIAQKFVNMHSTLKQSYFGGVVRAEIDEFKSFPFI